MLQHFLEHVNGVICTGVSTYIGAQNCKWCWGLWKNSGSSQMYTPVFESSLPSEPIQSGRIRTVSPHACVQRLTKSQAGGSDRLQDLWQGGSQSVVECGSYIAVSTDAVPLLLLLRMIPQHIPQISVLIAPFWPNKPQFGLSLTLLTDPLCPLLISPDLLSQMIGWVWHSRHHTFKLWVWTLCAIATHLY